jgi:hypothetical protein
METTYCAAREQLKALMDRVLEDQEVVVVRRGGEAGVWPWWRPRSWRGCWNLLTCSPGGSAPDAA